MKVYDIGIDPGTFESAYAILENGVLIESGKNLNEKILEDITFFCYIHGHNQNENSCTAVAIEEIKSYGMAVGAEVFETVWWAGRFWESFSTHTNWPPERIPRKEVCGHICNDAKAKDANIRQALIDRLGPSTKKELHIRTGKKGQELKPKEVTVKGPTYGVTKDEWSALAIALTAYDKREKK